MSDRAAKLKAIGALPDDQWVAVKQLATRLHELETLDLAERLSVPPAPDDGPLIGEAQTYVHSHARDGWVLNVMELRRLVCRELAMIREIDVADAMANVVWAARPGGLRSFDPGAPPRRLSIESHLRVVLRESFNVNATAEDDCRLDLLRGTPLRTRIEMKVVLG